MMINALFNRFFNASYF